MIRSMRSLVLSALLLFGLTASAAAQPLALVPLGGPHTDAAATALTLELLEQEERAAGGGPVVYRGPALDAATCPGGEAVCFASIAKREGAQEMLSGHVAGTPGAYELRLRRWQSGQLKQAELTLRCSTDGLASVLRTLIRGFLRDGKLSTPGHGALLVWPAPESATLSVGGGPLPPGPALLPELPAGEHPVAATAPWHRSLVTRARVAEAQLDELRLHLAPGLDGPPPPTRRTWMTGAGAGVALAAGLAFGAIVRSHQSDFDAGEVDSQSLPDLLDHRDAGERAATLANVSFGLAGTAALTAAVLYVLDWRAARSAVEEQRSDDGSAPAEGRVLRWSDDGAQEEVAP